VVTLAIVKNGCMGISEIVLDEIALFKDRGIGRVSITWVLMLKELIDSVNWSVLGEEEAAGG
jgi:hypothetical protein